VPAFGAPRPEERHGGAFLVSTARRREAGNAAGAGVRKDTCSMLDV